MKARNMSYLFHINSRLCFAFQTSNDFANTAQIGGKIRTFTPENEIQ